MTYIIDSFLNIRFSDVIDILIVTFLIYKFFDYIRQTRAMNLLKGIIVVFLLWGLSVYFNFTMVKFLITNLMTLGLIFLVIVFQPELRIALEKLGRGSKFIQESIIASNKDDIIEMIEEIIKAVQDLSESKTGALIVLERETPLGDIADSGVKIFSNVNASLIGNLFFKNSPLHDGAILIKDRKIHAAACILPLSKNTSMNKNLGTRHRAAMGIAERTDAVVIIVSEETGTISIASDGKLARFVDIPGLESFLNSKFKSEKRENSVIGFLEKLKKEKEGEKSAR